jgi:hypothetical protein
MIGAICYALGNHTIGSLTREAEGAGEVEEFEIGQSDGGGNGEDIGFRVGRAIRSMEEKPKHFGNIGKESDFVGFHFKEADQEQLSSCSVFILDSVLGSKFLRIESESEVAKFVEKCIIGGCFSGSGGEEEADEERMKVRLILLQHDHLEHLGLSDIERLLAYCENEVLVHPIVECFGRGLFHWASQIGRNEIEDGHSGGEPIPWSEKILESGNGSHFEGIIKYLLGKEERIIGEII